MAKDGFKVMDSAMHIIEPADLWDRYIDPDFKDRGPKGLCRHPRDLGIEMGGRIYPPENRSYTTGGDSLQVSQVGGAVLADAAPGPNEAEVLVGQLRPALRS